MSKKSKRLKQLQRKPQLDRLIEQNIRHAQHQIQQGDFAGAIQTCEPLLHSLPRRSSQRVEVLALLGLAHGMSQNFERSYDLFSEALTIDPTNAELWYNHGLACRFTTRAGQSVRSFEQAVKLSGNDTGELSRKFAKELEVSREELQDALRAQREPITLDQYIQREELFMRAMKLMRLSKWQEAEKLFHQIIDMGGPLPQYWGNLGVSLIMQMRYDEAEAALKHALEINPTYPIARDNLAKLPQIRKSKRPLDIELRDLTYRPDVKQSLTLYNKGDTSSSPTAHTTIEKVGDTIKGSRKALGKQPPLYRFFLNPYPDVRFTTCPQCRGKTRLRKFPLVIHKDPIQTLILGKTCRYCPNCDLLIVHQDELEEQLAAYFSTTNPEMIGNDYLVMGTLDKPEWKQGMKDPLTLQEMLEHLHDFKEAVKFQPAYF